MKRIAKKSLSVLLAVILAFTMFVTAFAQSENSEEIFMFNMDIDYKTNSVSTIYFVIMGYSVLNADAFACSIFDSDENEVFDQSMCNVSAISPELLGAAEGAMLNKALAEDPGEDPLEFMLVYLYVNEEFIVNPDETYTMEIDEHAFSAADGTLSEMYLYEFLPSDYIYIPTIWDKILWVLHSNPILEFLFARVIMVIEFFYYNSWYLPFFPIIG
jgi:hypothetical protein